MNGHVRVRWNLRTVASDGQHLTIDWIERGGPRVSPPSRKGFGSQLLEQGLKKNVGARVELEFHPDGLRCRLDLPVPDGEPDGMTSLDGMENH